MAGKEGKVTGKRSEAGESDILVGMCVKILVLK